MHSQSIDLQAADGQQFSAWVATPEGPPRGAIVVLQEIFGVNPHIRAVTERFAARGYLAVAPALFTRVQPLVELGYSAEDMQAGMALKAAVEQLPGAGVLPDIQAAIDYAQERSGTKVVAVGFCWGGLLAWRAACTLHGLLLRWRHDQCAGNGPPAALPGAGAFWPARPLDCARQRAGLCPRPPRRGGACL